MMLVSVDDFNKFSGVTSDNESLTEIYISAAGDVITHYLGYSPESLQENNPFFIDGNLEIPGIIKLVCLEIATLMQMEEGQNIGINNNNFNASGSRTFLNVVDYTKYLTRISQYRKPRTF